jgi:hypothetical protein
VVSFIEEAGDKMSMMLTISDEPGFLRVNVGGNFSLPEAKRTFIEILEAVARSKVDKVLFDGRGLAGNLETMERFYYGEFTAESVVRFRAHGVSRKTRFAYVMVEPLRDPERFGETVAVNRGMVVQTFENDQDALAWLRIPSANMPAAGDAR